MVMREARDIGGWLSEIRRDLHRNPELGFAEKRTANLVERCLDELGIRHERMLGTGVVGLIEGGAEGCCVALRADMDALPLQDAKSGELCSGVAGVMHACGHDAHTACLLGAARLIVSHRSDLRGSVKLIFQPAEETDTGGALPMIEAGVLENPHVDALFGLHADPGCPAGSVAIADGYVHAASDMFDVTIRGRGGHGAYPQGTVDALYAACQCVSTLQSIVSRNVGPLESAVLTVGRIQSGTVRNVISANAAFSGIIRTLDPDVRETVKKRFGDVVRGLCASLGAEVDIEMKSGYPMLHNDPVMVDFMRDTAAAAIGAEHVLNGKPSLGVEDFAYFAQKRPGCFFSLGVRNEERGIVHPLHSEHFDVDEGALPVGAALLASAALAYTPYVSKR